MKREEVMGWGCMWYTIWRCKPGRQVGKSHRESYSLWFFVFV